MKETRPSIVEWQGYGEALDPERIAGAERCLEIDWERCEEVLGTLLEAYRNVEFPYDLDRARVPQDERHLPESIKDDPEAYSMFLFTSCYYMRGGIKSNQAFVRLGKLWQEQPDLFIPEKAKDLDEGIVAAGLKSVGLGFQDAVASQLVRNSRKLYELYEGDPRKIFDGVTTYEEACARIMNDQKGGGFVGFQEKMVSMIAYYLVAEGLIEPFHFPLPVDIHVFRVTAATGMIRFHGFEESTQPTMEMLRELDTEPRGSDLVRALGQVAYPGKISDDHKKLLGDNRELINKLWRRDNIYSTEALDYMRHLYSEYAIRHNVDMIELCNVVWLLSQTICGDSPGNQMHEPLGREMRSGRSTLLIQTVLELGSFAQRRAYANTCGRCPLNDNCSKNVLGKGYYVNGEIIMTPRSTDYEPLPEQFSLF